MLTSRTWEVAFQDAVYESDPMMAELKLLRAEAAIFDRIQHFSRTPGSGEEQALFDALCTIRSLRCAQVSPKLNVPSGFPLNA